MGGNLPKPPEQRRRRNKTSTATVLYDERGPIAIPELPMADPHPLTVAHWSDLWASPVAPEMTRIDAHGLLIYIALVEDFHRADNPTARMDLSREIRLVRADFGLTPVSRRRLQWTVAKVADAEARRTERIMAKYRQAAADSRPDPRLRS
jgi:hypothetical protein